MSSQSLPKKRSSPLLDGKQNRSNSPNWRSESPDSKKWKSSSCPPILNQDDKIEPVLEDIRKQKSESLRVLLTTSGLKKYFFLLSKEEKKNLLIVAVVHNNVNAVQLLIDHYYKHCEKNSEDAHPLRLAVKRGNHEIVELLLKCGVFNPGSEMDYAFREACKSGYSYIAKLLCDDPRVSPSTHNQQGLIQACEGGHFGTVHNILKHPAIDPTVNRKKALRIAIEKKFFKVIDELLNHPKLQSLSLSMTESLENIGYNTVERKKKYISPTYKIRPRNSLRKSDESLGKSNGSFDTPWKDIVCKETQTSLVEVIPQGETPMAEPSGETPISEPLKLIPQEKTLKKDDIAEQNLESDHIVQNIVEMLNDAESGNPPGFSNLPRFENPLIAEYGTLMKQFQCVSTCRNISWINFLHELLQLCNMFPDAIYLHYPDKFNVLLTLKSSDYRKTIHDLLTNLCIKYITIFTQLIMNNDNILITTFEYYYY